MEAPVLLEKRAERPGYYRQEDIVGARTSASPDFLKTISGHLSPVDATTRADAANDRNGLASAEIRTKGHEDVSDAPPGGSVTKGPRCSPR